MANAPVSIISGDILPDVEGLDLTFKPQIAALAALPLPSNLPLDFLAGNFRNHIYFNQDIIIIFYYFVRSY